MERFQKALDGLRKLQSPQVQQVLGAVARYLDTGDPASMKLVMASTFRGWVLSPLALSLRPPGELDEFDRRLLSLLAALNQVSDVVNWLARSRESQICSGAFPQFVAELRQLGFTQTQIDALALDCAHLGRDGDCSGASIGGHVLEMDEARLTDALNVDTSTSHIFHQRLHNALKFVLKHAPERVEPALKAGLAVYGEERLCLHLLQWFGDRFETRAARCFFELEDGFGLGMQLVKIDPNRYAAELAKRLPAHLAHQGLWSVNWVLPNLGAMAVGAFVDRLTGEEQSAVYNDAAKVVLEHIAKHGGDQAKPGLLKVLEKSESAVIRAAALGHLVEMKDPALREMLETAIERGMTGDARDAARFAVLAAQFADGRLRERLWQDLSAKSKLRREGAAEALAAGDAQALDRAAALLSDKSKDTRWGAVLVLGKLATPEAVDCLLNWLPREDSEEVRDEVARALRRAGVGLEAIVRQLGPIDLAKLREQGARIGAVPVKWLGEKELPPLRMIDGQTLDAPLVQFLLHRQSRQKEPIIDPEAAPLYALIDRRSSGDFAFCLLNAFLEADAPKVDAWAMIVAGVLGDNRVITTLANKIRAWALAFAQKLGEWGIDALTLNGSDAALTAVDSIATKFRDNPRRKFKVIAEAAQNAMEVAAKRLGLTTDELADRIVPTMGFESGRPRRIEAGKRVIEATIGLDFKLAMKDAETGKRAISIPKVAAPEVVAEFKGLGKLLLEVAKSQATRLENLMVSQRRWTAARWRERFLQHPVLFPFAVRLVWGVYDGSGVVRQTFRALPDRSLTDSDDEPVELPADDALVGIVHPLDLSPEQIDAWRVASG